MAVKRKSIDWAKVKEWDEKYYLHILASEREYTCRPVARTEGRHLYLPDGSRLLDFVSIHACANIGHSYPSIQEALKEALDNFGYVGESVFCSEYRSHAAQLLMEQILGDDQWAGRVHFSDSGSEAVEEALIIARLFTNRPNIITREHAFHGRTMGAGNATQMLICSNGLASDTTDEIREVPGFKVSGYHAAPAPFCYRCSLGHEYPSCKLRGRELPCIKVMRDMIERLGAWTVAAVITETFQGTGCIVPPPEYIPQLRRMTQELGVLWIDDEVVTGFGRLGKWFGYQLYEGVKPDIMTIAKGLTSAALPIGGVVISKEIADFMYSYRWLTVGTYPAHPLVMAVLVANLEALIEMNAPAVVSEKGQYLRKRLTELENRHKCLGLVKGAGLWYELELVKNKQTKEPFIKEDKLAKLSGDISKWPCFVVRAKCAEKGVFTGGFYPNSLRMAPPFTITYEEIDEGIEAHSYAFSELDKMCT